MFSACNEVYLNKIKLNKRWYCFFPTQISLTYTYDTRKRFPVYTLHLKTTNYLSNYNKKEWARKNAGQTVTHSLFIILCKSIWRILYLQFYASLSAHISHSWLKVSPGPTEKMPKILLTWEPKRKKFSTVFVNLNKY